MMCTEEDSAVKKATSVSVRTYHYGIEAHAQASYSQTAGVQKARSPEACCEEGGGAKSLNEVEDLVALVGLFHTNCVLHILFQGQYE